MSERLLEKRPMDPVVVTREVAAILDQWRADEPFWVFAYGSLMWNPGFDFEERVQARLYGYHRAFCIYSYHYRGTPEHPGLVLGLDRGGSCQGVCYRVARRDIADVTEYLWRREMLTNVYMPRRARAQINAIPARKSAVGGAPIAVQTFVADPKHVQYCGRLALEEAAEIIGSGVGEGGSNVDYLLNTVGHLDELGIADGSLRALRRLIEGRG